ncbi:3476_t:CDS:2, partial [Racocetra fulgida]
MQKNGTDELKEFEGYVKKYVKKSLNSDQFDALVSFAYNTGEGAIKSVANIINSKRFSKVRSEMAKYNKVTIEENGKE